MELNPHLTNVISSGPEDPVLLVLQNHKATVTKVMFNNFLIKKAYIDSENSVDISYHGAYDQIRL